jgi:hypothetical protein
MCADIIDGGMVHRAAPLAAQPRALASDDPRCLPGSRRCSFAREERASRSRVDARPLGTRSIRADKPRLARLLHRQSIGALTGDAPVSLSSPPLSQSPGRSSQLKHSVSLAGKADELVRQPTSLARGKLARCWRLLSRSGGGANGSCGDEAGARVGRHHAAPHDRLCPIASAAGSRSEGTLARAEVASAFRGGCRRNWESPAGGTEPGGWSAGGRV